MITPDFEVAVGGYAEGDEASSAAAGDLTGVWVGWFAEVVVRSRWW